MTFISLGAVLLRATSRSYRTFTRRYARLSLLEQITSQEVKPPRQIDDAVPKELERICLKALAKRGSERFTTALDMAEDLTALRGRTHGNSRQGLRTRWRDANRLRFHAGLLPTQAASTRTASRSVSSPRGCDLSTSTTRISSWKCTARSPRP